MEDEVGAGGEVGEVDLGTFAKEDVGALCFPVMVDDELGLGVTAGNLCGMLDLVGFSGVACGELGFKVAGWFTEDVCRVVCRVLVLDVLICLTGVVCDRVDLEVAGYFIGEVCGKVNLGVFVYFT